MDRKPLTVLFFIFSSKQAIFKAYNSSEYQELSKLRWANLTDTNLIIMDGVVTIFSKLD